MPAIDEEQIFQAARRILDPLGRLRFIRDQCGDDPKWIARVEALLRVHDENIDFLRTPAVDANETRFWCDVESPDSEIGPYRLVRKIGEGGFGVVYLAEQLSPIRRQVALKLIKPGMDSREVVQRFENERQALAMMDHPNIARILDGGQTRSGRPFFVMDLVQGTPLCQFADQNRLSIRERLELISAVATAVQHAHQKGVIHRDLKPSNLLVSVSEGRPLVKVIDFGVAKAIGSDHPDVQLTGHLQMVGTPLYMSPEQARGGGLDVDTRSDIYSLGVVLYELLTGFTAFDRAALQKADWSEVQRIIREQVPLRPSIRVANAGDQAQDPANARRYTPPQLVQALRRDLDWIVMKCLEKDRTQRYPTVNGLMLDIERFLAGDPVQAGPPATSYRIWKLALKYRRALSLAGVFLLVLVFATTVSLLQAFRAAHAESNANSERDRAWSAKNLADEESSISRAVNSFLLQDLLGQADIGNQSETGQRNRDITVRELLDRASQRLPGRFDDQPRTAAAILTTLGLAYQGIGEAKLAETHLRQAVATLEKSVGPLNAETIRARQKLGWILLERGKTTDAETIFKQILELQRQRLGLEDPETLSAMNMLGAAYLQMGRLAESEEILTDTLKRRERTLGAGHTDTIESVNNLGVIYSNRGRYAEGEQYLRRAMTGWTEILGEDHPKTLSAMAGLAAAMLIQGQFADAEPLLTKGLELAQTKLGPDHPQTLSYLNDLANLYSETGRAKQAGPMYEQVLQTRIAKFGESHPKTLDAMTNLAIFHTQNNQTVKAAELFASVLRVQQQSLGPEHPDTIISLNNLAYFYQTLGRNAEAEPLLIEALAAARQTFGPSHPNVVVMANNLAKLKLELGKSADAEVLLREIVQLQLKSRGAGSIQYAGQLEWLAVSLIQQAKFVEAENVARESIDIRNAHQQQGWPLSSAQGILGACLSGQMKYADAEPLLLQSYQGMKAGRVESSAEWQIAYLNLLQWLVRHFEATEKPEEAARYRAELESAQDP